MLLINDGSTHPHVEKMLKAVEAADGHFRYLYKPNTGVSDTRNLGIEMAQSRYITFVDADDYLESGAFRYMLEKIEETNAEMAFFGYCRDDIRIGNDDWKEEVSTVKEKDKYLKNILGNCTKSLPKEAFGLNLHGPYSKVYRKDFIDRCDLKFDKRIAYAEDAFFLFQCMINSQRVYLDSHMLYHYISNPESVTMVCTQKRIHNLPVLLEIWENYIQRVSSGSLRLIHYLGKRALVEIRGARDQYFTHPENRKSFWHLRSELVDFLSHPIVCKNIGRLCLSDAEDRIELKNIILLKLHLYRIFLLTERRRRRKHYIANIKSK